MGEGASTGRNRTLWVARMLGVAAAIAPVLFALEGLGHRENRSVGVELGVHLALATPLLVAIVLAWSRLRLGALVYSLLGASYALALFNRAGAKEMIVFCAPLFFIGALFWRASVPPRDDP